MFVTQIMEGQVTCLYYMHNPSGQFTVGYGRTTNISLLYTQSTHLGTNMILNIVTNNYISACVLVNVFVTQITEGQVTYLYYLSNPTTSPLPPPQLVTEGQVTYPY